MFLHHSSLNKKNNRWFIGVEYSWNKTNTTLWAASHHHDIDYFPITALAEVFYFLLVHQIYSWMDSMVAAHPNLISKVQIGSSYEKRPMFVLKVRIKIISQDEGVSY